MALTDAMPATTERPPPDVRGRRGLAIGVLAVAVAVAGWWWVTTPSLSAGGAWGVWSADHDVHVVTGHHEVLYVVPADTPGETTLMFELDNEGRLPVRLVDVWPRSEHPSCFWEPRVRELRDDLRTRYTYDSPARPAVGATIPSGGSASVWLTGTQQAPRPCYEGGMGSTTTVDVVVAVAGRTSTVSVPLGYAFGWAGDPEEFTEQYGVTVVPPDPGVRVE